MNSATRPVRASAALPLMLVLAIGACSSAKLASTRFEWVPSADLEAIADDLQRPATVPEVESATGSDEAFATWVKGPVAAILTDSEHERIDALQTSAQQAAFIERFWKRRDPDPRDSINEYRQEFERRVATADAAFGSDEDPGWSTRFGIALLIFGFPYDVTVTARNEDDLETRDGSMAIPVAAKGGDQVLWRYGMPGAAPTRPARARGRGAPQVGYVRFGYAGGAWRMSCGSQLIFDSWLAGGYGYGQGVGGYGAARGKAGEPWAAASDAVDADAISSPGPLLTGNGVYSTAPPMISAGCIRLIDDFIVHSMRGLIY